MTLDRIGPVEPPLCVYCEQEPVILDRFCRDCVKLDLVPCQGCGCLTPEAEMQNVNEDAPALAIRLRCPACAAPDCEDR